MSTLIEFNYDYALYRMEEIKNDIKIIGTRAAWLLGILVVIVLALASFIFKDFDLAYILSTDINNSDHFIKLFAIYLFISYFGLIIIYIPRILPEGVEVPTDNEFENVMRSSKNAKIAELQKRIKENADKLHSLNQKFNTLILFFVSSPFYALIFATVRSFLF